MTLGQRSRSPQKSKWQILLKQNIENYMFSIHQIKNVDTKTDYVTSQLCKCWKLELCYDISLLLFALVVHLLLNWIPSFILSVTGLSFRETYPSTWCVQTAILSKSWGKLDSQTSPVDADQYSSNELTTEKGTNYCDDQLSLWPSIMIKVSDP